MVGICAQFLNIDLFQLAEYLKRQINVALNKLGPLKAAESGMYVTIQGMYKST